jgi:hemolysin activation/secretion protein
MEPTPAPQVGAPVPAVPGGPLTNAAPEQPVVVRAVTIEGATIYPKPELDALTQGLVGSAVPLRQIEQARLDLVRKYREDGYPLVSVQATRSADGVLHFVVFEGHIAEVKLQGDIGPAGVQVLRFLNHLTEVKPLDNASLERWLLLAQDVPGVSMQTVLRPSDTEPGALTLVAVVRRAAVSGLFTADNRAYQLSGPIEGMGVVDFNSFSSLGERTELSLFRTFNSTQIFGQAAEEFYVGGSGLKVRLYGGAGNTTPAGFLREEGYNGTTTVGGVQVSYPLIRRRQQTLNLIGAFDLLDSVVNVGSPAMPNSKESVRAFRAGGDYALQDLLLGVTRPGVNGVSVRVSRGINGLGASQNTATPSRQGEKLAFTKAAFELSRNQTLFAPWSGASVSLLGLAAGQVADTVLPNAEKFFLGGSRYTRGFYSGQVSGDNALALTAELQLTTGLGLSLLGRPIDIGTQYYLFYDWGETWENQSTDPNKRLRSFGLGVRGTLTQYVEVDLEGVRRITTNPDGLSTTKLKADEFYWRLLVRF